MDKMEKVKEEFIPGENYAIAAFAFRKQTGPKKPKAVIVLVPGSNSDGRYMIHDRVWTKFADKFNLAICACYFADFNPGTEEDYCKVGLGSGQALLDALEKEGYGDTPLMFWGFSAGGQFNYEFACWRPDRVMAFVVNKGGVYFTARATPETRAVPAVFFAGEFDAAYRKFMVQGLYYLNMALGGCSWAIVVEKCAHSIMNSEQISLGFFEKVLTGKW